MSKFPSSDTSTIAVVVHPRSPEQEEEIARLKRDLSLISLKTVGGGIGPFTQMVWRQIVAKCAERLNKFEGIDLTTDTIADAFEKAVAESLPRR